MINQVFPMFVGCGRSGTTLFRNVFNMHPKVAITHEAHFLAPMASHRDRFETADGFVAEIFLRDLYNDSNFRRQGIEESAVRKTFELAAPKDFAEAVRIVFSQYAETHGKTIYGDKTPGSVNHIELLGSIFPEAKFVHIIRDGRAVALSYLERPEWGPKTMSEAAHHWRSRVRRGRKGGDAVGRSRYREVRYEDMVEDPSRVTAELCEFLGLDFDEQMLRYYEQGEEFIAGTKDPEAFKNLAKPVTQDLRDWRAEMSLPDQVLFESIAGDLLDDLGYEVTELPRARTTTRAAIEAVKWQGKRARAYAMRLARERRSR